MDTPSKKRRFWQLLTNLIFGKTKPKLRKVDPVFGSIEFDANIWAYIPKGKDQGFMIVIVAPDSGPSERQRKFYDSLARRLNQVEQQAKQFIAMNGTVDPSSLSIYSIEIGDDTETKEGSFVLELSDGQADEIHRVEFDKGVPSSYGVDC